jgi:predicted DNA-binding transcriptional regulator AlpA
MAPRVLRLNEVVQVTSLSRSTIWRLESAGQFPRRISLSGHRVGWLENDIDQWIASRRGPSASLDPGVSLVRRSNHGG